MLGPVRENRRRIWRVFCRNWGISGVELLIKFPKGFIREMNCFFKIGGLHHLLDGLGIDGEQYFSCWGDYGSLLNFIVVLAFSNEL